MRLEIVVFVLIAVFGNQKTNSQEINRVRRTMYAMCPPQFQRIGTECYYISNQQVNWLDAHFECKDKNSKLAEPVKQADRLLRKYLQSVGSDGTDIWIGGSYDWEKNRWIWGQSGEPMVYQSFSKMDPRWSARPCVEKLRYLCQHKMPKVSEKNRNKVYNKWNETYPNQMANEVLLEVVEDWESGGRTHRRVRPVGGDEVFTLPPVKTQKRIHKRKPVYNHPSVTANDGNVEANDLDTAAAYAPEVKNEYIDGNGNGRNQLTVKFYPKTSIDQDNEVIEISTKKSRNNKTTRNRTQFDQDMEKKRQREKQRRRKQQQLKRQQKKKEREEAVAKRLAEKESLEQKNQLEKQQQMTAARQQWEYQQDLKNQQLEEAALARRKLFEAQEARRLNQQHKLEEERKHMEAERLELVKIETARRQLAEKAAADQRAKEDADRKQREEEANRQLEQEENSFLQEQRRIKEEQLRRIEEERQREEARITAEEMARLDEEEKRRQENHRKREEELLKREALLKQQKAEEELVLQEIKDREEADRREREEEERRRAEEDRLRHEEELKKQKQLEEKRRQKEERQQSIEALRRKQKEEEKRLRKEELKERLKKLSPEERKLFFEKREKQKNKTNGENGSSVADNKAIIPE